MPLPSEATTITGGCSCGVIRYRVAIPESSHRPPMPFAPPESGLQMPFVATCHCNDCRRATGSALPIALLQVPSPMITVSILPYEASESNVTTGRILDVLDEQYDRAKADAARPPYLPAMDVLRAVDGSGRTTDGSSTWLRFFHSFACGPGFSRSFCGRCGTQVCFHFNISPDFCYGGKLPDGWSDMFDLNLGTVDREFLEKDWLVPDSEVNFKHGVLLGKTVSATAKYLKPLSKAQGLGDEDGMVTEDELAALAAE